MKKQKEQPQELSQQKKDRLNEGERVFYYDGVSQWTIETVESIDKAAKQVTLSNNAIISRYPTMDGTFGRIGSPNKPAQYITKLTPELEKLRNAIICKQRIERTIFKLQQTVLKKADTRDWQRWSISKQEKLINIADHLAKALEEAELD